MKENEINQNEINNKQEFLQSESLGKKEMEKLTLLSDFWGKINAFGDNEHDEFSIINENGENRGVFKTWAHPVIPFLDTPELSDFHAVSTHIVNNGSSRSFEAEVEDLIDQSSDLSESALTVKNTLDAWVKNSLEKPEKFSDILERARVDSRQLDKRLVECFEEEDLSQIPEEKVSQLVNRLILSIGLLSPFYDIEAILGDSRDFKWNPISVAQKESPMPLGGGKLDIVGLMLPSVLGKYVTSEERDWNGLDWEKIKLSTTELLNDPKKSQLLIKLSEITSVPPHHIVFAANALEWVPGRPGGKKGDFDDATEISKLFEDTETQDQTNQAKLLRIGKDLNALIRFMNWTPLIENSDNMEYSTKWSYASVSDTSSQLIDMLSENLNLWKEEFIPIFEEVIFPQIQKFDATSAKGRALLEYIILDGKLKQDISNNFPDKQWQQSIISKIVEKRQGDYLINLGDGVKPRMLIGGKIFGLEEMMNNLPLEIAVPQGYALNAEFVEDLLKSDDALWSLIVALNKEQDIYQKLELGSEIQRRIKKLEIPSEVKDTINTALYSIGSEKYVVRSSSFDEDGRDGKSGAGVYESILEVTEDGIFEAITECTSTFFSDKAIQFRNLFNHSDFPKFATLIQPFVKGKVGTSYSRDVQSSEDGILVEFGESANEVTSGGTLFESRTENDFIQGSGQVNLQEVFQVTRKIKALKKEDVDIEWVVDKNGKTWFLQMRTLPGKSKKIEEKISNISFVLEDDQSLKPIIEGMKSTDRIATIVLKGKNRNLDTFQGELFTMIAQYGKRIAEIQTEQVIPHTSHFSNICSSLDIRLTSYQK